MDAEVGKDGVGEFLARAGKGVAPEALGEGAKGERGVVGEAVECVEFAVPEESVGESGCDRQWAEVGRGDGEGGVGVERCERCGVKFGRVCRVKVDVDGRAWGGWHGFCANVVTGDIDVCLLYEDQK